MKLTVMLEDETRDLEVSQDMIDSAQSLFTKMDADMDNGWTLGREFIASPDTLQRCQIAADRMLTGMHTGNQSTIMLMAAYIFARLEDVKTVMINTEGESGETIFYNNVDAMIS